MRLTDAKMCKALGWRRCKRNDFQGGTAMNRQGDEKMGWADPAMKVQYTYFSTPPFTTSLDAIVGEIEARCLDWGFDTRGNTAFIEGPGPKGYLAEETGDTAPLALCAALLAYLKEPKP